ncbi:ABC transporter ATP-binding protein [Acidimangrovimonas sediminis]|uniref:ABC transporter ATP-binding protein n=1 Tax=Acidimangrovimonas sediminis TaxID=2056283 RepID=UPI000C8015F3|nr:ABC transporter ATP-binding protein [Acidimangrovimonas sediminis]
MDPVLQIKDLKVEVDTGTAVHSVLDGVTLTLRRGQTLAVVGESGCGKSMTALSAMGLLPDRFRIAAGQILLGEEDLVQVRPQRLRALRGNAMSMIFQEPMTSLNPVLTVERQIAEVVELHQDKTGAQAREIALEMLRAVQIPSPETRLAAYPHELSGGMRQRVMIAIALACRPRVIIADEPTTALDVTVQAQIFRLLRELQMQTDTAIMLITHDMGAVAEMADEVAVLYAGKCIEAGPAAQLLAAPAHPYTSGLMACTPKLRLGRAALTAPARGLGEIPGMVPPLGQFPPACRFAPRCARATEKCHATPPETVRLGPDHETLCWHPNEAREAAPAC